MQATILGCLILLGIFVIEPNPPIFENFFLPLFFAEIVEVKNVSIKMKQDIFIKDNLILTADVHLATINKEGKLIKMPEKLKEQLIK